MNHEYGKLQCLDCWNVEEKSSYIVENLITNYYFSLTLKITIIYSFFGEINFPTIIGASK